MVCIAVVTWQRTKTHCARYCMTTETKVTWIKIPTAFSMVETNSEYAHLSQPPPLWKMSVRYSDVLLVKGVSQPVAFAGQKKSQEAVSCPCHNFWHPSGHWLGTLSAALHPPACHTVTQWEPSQLSSHSTNGFGWSDRSSHLWLFLCLSHPIKNVYKGAVGGDEGGGSRRKEIQFCLETVSGLN